MTNHSDPQCESGGHVRGKKYGLFALAFVLVTGFPCEDVVASETLGFIKHQQEFYAESSDSRHKARSDFCQLLLASKGCLYME